MKKILPIIIVVLIALAGALAFFFTRSAGTPEASAPAQQSSVASSKENACRAVRFADVGWTDITATTAVASVILEELGYKPDTMMASVPITYIGLENKGIDVFLGNWMPTMEADVKPYLARGTVETLGTNLEGAKYTLAVPTYVYEAGVQNFADIAKFAKKFDFKIHGIEPGNDGNRLIQDMITKNAFGLKEFQLVESSEAGMLAEATRKVNNKDWVVFLAWAPHPMNANLDITYLPGGDAFFGPNLGGAVVNTNVRQGYTSECPNVGRFLSNLKFTLDAENQIMKAILDDGQKPADAARAWIRKNPETLNAWLRGVTTESGQSASSAIDALTR